jgi:hypothetical protein
MKFRFRRFPMEHGGVRSEAAIEANQHSLFGESDDRIPSPPPPSLLPDPDAIRRRLHTLLAKAREAERMPWDERKARMWQIVFPQMANWLPEEERDQLRFEFAQEFERLKNAA